MTKEQRENIKETLKRISELANIYASDSNIKTMNKSDFEKRIGYLYSEIGWLQDINLEEE